MLNQSKGRFELTRYQPVATGFSVTQEGIALIFVDDGGTAKVRPSAGAAGTEIFAGVAYGHTMVPGSATLSTTITAVGTTLTLPYTPISGQIGLWDVAQALAVGNPATTANQYSIAGNVVTLHSGQSGKPITVSIRYALTLEQAIALHGEGMIGDLANQDIFDVIGTILTGIVATDQFDVTAKWVAGGVPKLGANGQFTLGGSGPDVPRCIVKEVPSAANGYLVLELLP